MRASRRCIRMLALLVGCLLLAGGALFLAGCSNLGEFDASAVTRQAERYYERKYGERTKVLDIWEDRSFQLFSDQSSGRAFCTMEDGSTVLVDFEAGVIGDNRQQDEIVAAYEQRFRDALEDGTRQLEASGYTVDRLLINGSSPNQAGFLSGRISPWTWQRDEDAAEQTGSFFYTRYTGDEDFFAEEAPRVNLGSPVVWVELSGPHASYEGGFPMDVPEQPEWVEPLDELCRSLLPLTDGDPETRVQVYQAGYLEGGAEGCGKLGELNPFGAADGAGDWLIVDWIPLGHGVYATSDEPGVRLRADDLSLRVDANAYTFDELRDSGSLVEREGRPLQPEAFEVYQLEPAAAVFSSAPSDVQEHGWFNIAIAYDNGAVASELAQRGAETQALYPSLYSIEPNPAAAEHEDEPPYEIGMMRAETLENGFQYRTATLSATEPLTLARM